MQAFVCLLKRFMNVHFMFSKAFYVCLVRFVFLRGSEPSDRELSDRPAKAGRQDGDDDDNDNAISMLI